MARLANRCLVESGFIIIWGPGTVARPFECVCVNFYYMKVVYSIARKPDDYTSIRNVLHFLLGTITNIYKFQLLMEIFFSIIHNITLQINSLRVYVF